MVPALSCAGVAAGADALLIEVHPCPAEAWCDADQALTPVEFSTLMDRLDAIARAIGRRREERPIARTGERMRGAPTPTARASSPRSRVQFTPCWSPPGARPLHQRAYRRRSQSRSGGGSSVS